MAIPAQYQEISVEGLPALSERMQTEGHRFVQVLAVNTEAGIDVQYTFMKDGVLEVFTIKGVTPEIPIPSITDRFIAAFVFENEIHDLFGVNVRDIAIDFGGNFYVTAQPSPMTIISPAQKAAREKARAVIAELREMKLKEAAKKVEDGIEETLTYCDFPSEHWTRIRTNNVIERLNREIRRRTRVVGAFPDGNSALMLVCARLRHVAGTQWGSKKYMNMKHLEVALGDSSIA